MSGRRWTVFVLTCVALVTCRPDDQRTDTVDVDAARGEMTAEVVAHLDSGNVAFRVDDYAGARRHFRVVVELDPESAPGWFGLYMAEQAVGNVEAADAAFRRAQDIAPGASLIHPTAEDSLR